MEGAWDSATKVIDQAIEYVYSLEPIFAPTVVLGTLR